MSSSLSSAALYQQQQQHSLSNQSKNQNQSFSNPDATHVAADSIQPIKSKLQDMEMVYKYIGGQLTDNLKSFDDINLKNKQTFQTIERNLEDVKSIYEKDIDKFQENVDKGLKYNESLYERVQKDVHYLHNDQEMLKKKILTLQKKVDEMEEQIGNMNY